MPPRPRPTGLVILLVTGVTAAFAASSAPAEVAYNDHIQPILAENCFACHGPDSATRKGKLRLDRAEFSTKPRENGEREAVIVPGDPAASPLVERIRATDPEEIMPPADSHKKLKPAEIALLERWIADGAKYQEHWSFIAPTRPAVPDVPLARGWGRNPIDHFIAEKLAEAQLRPSPEEGRARLLRRVAFDLTGLPPSPADIEAFEADRSPDAYERAVDRMLASDASAEHFARYWLDAVRYADTHGIHIDNYRTIWPYRDWVINAYRRNLPFDQFTIEQMAGDMLPNAALEQKIASGYNRCLPTTSEGGAIAEEYEAIYAKDRVDTMSTVWLGLTTGCASCHDHKFDAITMRDFYALTAFFRNNTMPAMDGNVADTKPNLFIPAAGDGPRWSELQAELERMREQQKERAAAAEREFQAWLTEATTLDAPPADWRVKLHVPLSEPAGPIIIGGKPTGGIPERAPGVFGPAPRLNELDLVIGAPVTLGREDAMSVELLVRVEGKPCGTLLSSLSDDEKSAGWEVFFDDGRLGLYFVDASGATSVRSVATAAMAPGKWHHVLLVYDTATLRNRAINLYVDGRSVADSMETHFFPNGVPSAAPLRLGSRHGADGRAAAMLHGGDVWVQNIRHYDRGFAAAEVRGLAEMVETFAALKARPDKRTPAQKRQLKAHFLATVDGAWMQLAKQAEPLLIEEEQLRRRGAVTLVMQEKEDSEPFAHILNRGEYSQPGEKVSANVPAALPPLPNDAPRNRLALAHWLVAPENPLTARVTVNRAWQHVFGTGLVESAGDFGVMGSRPSHPALLDWLAVEFRDSRWDFRRLVRLMVTSATYRQTAAVTASLLERDPANRLLARGPRHRLEAEQLRDQALAASGLLVRKIGGHPVRPYQPDGIWEEVAMKESTTRFYRADVGDNLYRRSLYTLWKRTAPPPAMDILNAPSREVSCVRRDRTNTPLQALVTLNEPLFVEASRHLAAAAMRGAQTHEARMDVISRRLLGRKLAADERRTLQQTLNQAETFYRRDSAAAAKLLSVGESPSDARLPAAELAAWTVVANLVMNLDEALTK